MSHSKKSRQAPTSAVASALSSRAAGYLGANARDAVERLKSAGEEQLEKAEALIKERPLPSIAAAVAFGALLRSWLGGPTMTFILIGGGIYAGYRLGASKAGTNTAADDASSAEAVGA